VRVNEKTLRNVHDVHQRFRFNCLSDERYIFITFTNVHLVHLWSSLEFPWLQFHSVPRSTDPSTRPPNKPKPGLLGTRLCSGFRQQAQTITPATQRKACWGPRRLLNGSSLSKI